MKLLSYIPGFRSKTVWKMIIAIVYYIISLLLSFAIGLDCLLFLWALPFIVINIISAIRHKDKQYLLFAACAFIVAIASLVFIPGRSQKNVAPTPSPTTAIATQSPTVAPTSTPTATPVVAPTVAPTSTETPIEQSQLSESVSVQEQMQDALNIIQERFADAIIKVEAYSDEVYNIYMTNDWYLLTAEEKQYFAEQIYTILKNRYQELSGKEFCSVIFYDSNLNTLAKSKLLGGMEIKR